MATFYLESVPLEPIFRLFEVATTFLSLSDVHKTQNKHCGGLLPGPGSSNLAANSNQKCLLTSSSEDLLLAPNGLFTPAEIEQWLFTYSRAFCFVTYFIDHSFFHIFSKKDKLTVHPNTSLLSVNTHDLAEVFRRDIGDSLEIFQKTRGQWNKSRNKKLSNTRKIIPRFLRG